MGLVLQSSPPLHPSPDDYDVRIYICITNIQALTPQVGIWPPLHRVDNRKRSSSSQDRIKNYVGKKLEPGLRSLSRRSYRVGSPRCQRIPQPLAYEVRPYLSRANPDAIENGCYGEWISRIPCHTASTVSIDSLTSCPGHSVMYDVRLYMTTYRNRNLHLYTLLWRSKAGSKDKAKGY